MSYESSRLSEAEEVPYTLTLEKQERERDSNAKRNAARESIITYSTVGESSIDETTTTELNDNKNFVSPYRPPSARSLQKGVQKDVPSERFYKRKRFWIICVSVSVVLSAIFIPLLFLVIVPAAVQAAVSQSTIGFDSINITNPTNDSFVMHSLGKVQDTGPFSATITFIGGLDIYFKGNLLGTVDLDPVDVSGGSGLVTGSSSSFKINDKSLISDLAATMMVAKNFTWNIKGTANVQSFGTNTKVVLDKTVNVLGSGGFNTTLLDLKISETPDKTLKLETTANLFNPSPIGIELGTITVQFEYNGTVMSTVSADNVFIVTQNNTLTMSGVTYLPKTDAERNNYVQVIEAYLTGKPLSTTARIVSIVPKSGPVDWLDETVKNLAPLSTVVGNTKPPEFMKGIDFGELSMKFTSDTPTISSKHVTANIQLPFDISFNISTVSQSLTLYYKGGAVFEIDTPSVPATNTATQIVLDFPETQIKILSNDLFSEFLKTVTTSQGADVVLAGETNVMATTIIGTAPIQGLTFNVSATIPGFDQFRSGSSSSSNVKVLGGTTDQIFMGFTVTMVSPLKDTFSAGKVTFHSFYKDQKIGTVVINDLSIGPGTNTLSAYGTLDDPVNNNGQELLNDFLSQKEINIEVRGFENSTDIPSLLPAFKAINMSSTISSFQQNLVSNTKVSTDPNTSGTNAIAEISNTYDAPISIYYINSSFSFGGNKLGSIELDIKDNPYFIQGNTVQSIQLPVTLEYNPSVLLSMTRNLALQNHLDVSVFDSLILLTKVDVPDVDVNVKPTPQALASFNLANFITTALARIPTTVNMETDVALGDYMMPLKYQQDIITTTDPSILQYVPKMAQPILDQVMTQTEIDFDTIFINNIDVASFDVTLNGHIPNTGPLRAEISFPSGTTASSNNVVLGTLQMPPLVADPINGITINNTSKFLVADVQSFANFVSSIYSATSVTWDMSTNIAVDTSGIKLGPITINKSFTLPGFSGVQNPIPVATTISSGQNGSINFSAQVGLTNPSIVGMELGTIVLNLSAAGKLLTVVTAKNVVIAPKNKFTVTFEGSISLSDGGTLGVLFGPSPPPLTAQGVSITPPRATGDVQWLTAIFRQLSFTVPFDPTALFKGKSQ